MINLKIEGEDGRDPIGPNESRQTWQMSKDTPRSSPSVMRAATAVTPITSCALVSH